MAQPAQRLTTPASRPPLQRRSDAPATRRVRTAERPMVRATVGIQASRRPELTVVPRRRRAARLVVVICTFVVVAMAGAAAFQTLLAQRQLEIDRTEQGISDAREEYEQLRRERAELRSPGRLALLATEMGMVAATESAFMTIDPQVVALVQSSSGRSGGAEIDAEADPLAQFRVVKSVAWGQR